MWWQKRVLSWKLYRRKTQKRTKYDNVMDGKGGQITKYENPTEPGLIKIKSNRIISDMLTKKNISDIRYTNTKWDCLMVFSVMILSERNHNPKVYLKTRKVQNSIFLPQIQIWSPINIQNILKFHRISKINIYYINNYFKYLI